MTLHDDVEFLRACCLLCADGLPAAANPATARAARALSLRVDAIERVLHDADTLDNEYSERLRQAVGAQVRELARVVDGFTPAVRLDAAQRQRVALLSEGLST